MCGTLLTSILLLLLAGEKAPFLVKLSIVGGRVLVRFVISSIMKLMQRYFFVSMKANKVPCGELMGFAN